MGQKTVCIDNELPFAIPSNWTWARLKNIASFSSGKTPPMDNRSLYGNAYLWVTSKDIKSKYISSSKIMLSENGAKQMTLYNSNTLLLVTRSGILRHTIPISILQKQATINQDIKAISLYLPEMAEYIYLCIRGLEQFILTHYTKEGTTVESINFDLFQYILLPIPPQKLMPNIVGICNSLIQKSDLIFNAKEKIDSYIVSIKYKILDQFFGENSRYKSYYENELKLGDILEYEQPAKYIVNSTDYSDEYSTPVLTPGKTFILGYTNEKDGIYKVNGKKVIIFDDFTTALRLVDFDFKVKSSAMKILTVSNEDLYDTEYMYLFLQTIHVNSNTHKRYWISDFATRNVKIHSLQEQKTIVQEIAKIYAIIEKVVG